MQTHTTLLTQLYTNRRGELRSLHSFSVCSDITDAELLDHAINRTSFYFSCGKKHFIRNEAVAEAVKAGDFKIIRD